MLKLFTIFIVIVYNLSSTLALAEEASHLSIAKTAISSHYHNVMSLSDEEAEEFFPELLIAAKNNDIAAQFWVGLMYMQQLGIRRNLKESEKWLARVISSSKKGEKNRYRAEYYLSDIYYYGGDTISKDYKKAANLLKSSAYYRYGPAEFKLGVMFEYGEGVNKDLGLALDLYRRAADKAHFKQTAAQERIGYLYLLGLGTPKNYQHAYDWYQKAALNGRISSMVQLTILHATGKATNASFTDAYAWANVASIGGNEKAIEMRTKLATRLSDKNIAFAQEKSEKLLESIRKNVHVLKLMSVRND